jgi:hypothetical protein
MESPLPVKILGWTSWGSQNRVLFSDARKDQKSPLAWILMGVRIRKASGADIMEPNEFGCSSNGAGKGDKSSPLAWGPNKEVYGWQKNKDHMDLPLSMES